MPLSVWLLRKITGGPGGSPSPVPQSTSSSLRGPGELCPLPLSPQPGTPLTRDRGADEDGHAVGRRCWEGACLASEKPPEGARTEGARAHAACPPGRTFPSKGPGPPGPHTSGWVAFLGAQPGRAIRHGTPISLSMVLWAPCSPQRPRALSRLLLTAVLRVQALTGRCWVVVPQPRCLDVGCSWPWSLLPLSQAALHPDSSAVTTATAASWSSTSGPGDQPASPTAESLGTP